MQRRGAGMLRLLEHYTSTQGEGPRVGEMTQFVRFAGCNLSCALWPCDSGFAIDPKLYRKEQKVKTALEIADGIRGQLRDTGASNICFTGGEPFLQPKEDLLSVINELHGEGYKFEVFTNGTIDIPIEFFRAGLTPVMDWKLPGSGEEWHNETRINNFMRLLDFSGSIKFTIATYEDFSTALSIWQQFIDGEKIEVFAGVVWNKMSPERLVEWIKREKLPWRLNVQIHNYVYGAHTRGT
jgi:7-carboxy-7-deazaguanine synthase